MYDVFHADKAVNYSILKVYNGEFVFHGFQEAIHHAYEPAMCVRQASRQDLALIHT